MSAWLIVLLNNTLMTAWEGRPTWVLLHSGGVATTVYVQNHFFLTHRREAEIHWKQWSSSRLLLPSWPSHNNSWNGLKLSVMAVTELRGWLGLRAASGSLRKNVEQTASPKCAAVNVLVSSVQDNTCRAARQPSLLQPQLHVQFSGKRCSVWYLTTKLTLNIQPLSLRDRDDKLLTPLELVQSLFAQLRSLFALVKCGHSPVNGTNWAARATNAAFKLRLWSKHCYIVQAAGKCFWCQRGSNLFSEVNSQKLTPHRKHEATHQKRFALLRPESPTSELLLRPDAVFSSACERRKKKKEAPSASSLWFPRGRRYFLLRSVAYIRGAVASSGMACFGGFKVSLPVGNRKPCRWVFSRCERKLRGGRRWLLVDLSVSSASWRCLPPHRRIGMSTGKQRHPMVVQRRKQGGQCRATAAPTGEH